MERPWRFYTEWFKVPVRIYAKTSKDYGNPFSIGEHAIGMQEEPCSFQIVPTGMIIDILM